MAQALSATGKPRVEKTTGAPVVDRKKVELFASTVEDFFKEFADQQKFPLQKGKSWAQENIVLGFDVSKKREVMHLAASHFVGVYAGNPVAKQQVLEVVSSVLNTRPLIAGHVLAATDAKARVRAAAMQLLRGDAQATKNPVARAMALGSAALP